jgi:D-3-phosphoglycerate dehydrogenase / 2-oxoglutarate reductase
VSRPFGRAAWNRGATRANLVDNPTYTPPVEGRVLVTEPGLPLALARDLLRGVVRTIDRNIGAWSGDDVVGLLVGPDATVAGEDLDRLPKLRAVATCSVGYDHIDLAAAERRGVWVCNVPDYCVEEVADHTLALLTGLLRGVVILDRSVADGGWDHRAAGILHRIARTRLGVVGCGRIGRAVASRALALRMEVWGFDPLVPDDVLARAGIRPSELDELLASCTAVSLHAALAEDNRGMIGVRELGLVPEGAFLVNTARAGLVDMEAVLDALDSGKLAGAAFDVLSVEPPTSHAPPPRHDRLVVTPHAGWFSPEALGQVYRRAVLSVRDVLENKEPRDVVIRGRM